MRFMASSPLLWFEIVRRVPSPRVRPAAALVDALDVDLGNDVAVPAQQSLGGAHLGAERQFALGDPVAPVQFDILQPICPAAGRRRRRCTCPSCRGRRRTSLPETAARRKGRRRSSSRSRCTDPCRAARCRPASCRSNRPGRRPRRAHPCSACRPRRWIFRRDSPSFRVTTCRRLMPQGTSCSLLHAVTQPLHSMQRSASQRNFILAMVASFTPG